MQVVQEWFFLAVGVVSWPYFSRLQNPLYIIFGNAHLIGISFSTSPPFSALFLLVLRSSVCITCNNSFLGVYRGQNQFFAPNTHGRKEEGEGGRLELKMEFSF